MNIKGSLGEGKLDNNRKRRTIADIKHYRVDTAYPGVDGWVVFIRYHDGWCASFSIDRPDKHDDILQTVAECIKKQLEG